MPHVGSHVYKETKTVAIQISRVDVWAGNIANRPGELARRSGWGWIREQLVTAASARAMVHNFGRTAVSPTGDWGLLGTVSLRARNTG